MTLSLISTVTVGAGGAASISFTGIPQTGTDLLIVLSGRGDAAAIQQPIFTRINGTTGTFYSERQLYGTGSAAASTNRSAGSEFRYVYMTGSSTTSSTFSNTSIYIPNYTSANNKSVSIESTVENNATGSWQNINAGLWSSTAAITSLSLLPDAANFVQYSTASLYTITKGSGGATVA